MSEILLIAQVVLTVIIIILVLLQKSSSMGLGAYSGSNESMFGAKGPTSFLAKTTMVIGLVFVINTLTLGYIYNQSSQTSILDDKIIDNKTNVPANTQEPLAPSVPSIPNSK